jgi:hypothetical protein
VRSCNSIRSRCSFGNGILHREFKTCTIISPILSYLSALTGAFVLFEVLSLQRIS